MKVNLSKITDILSGYSFRKSIYSSPQNGYFVVRVTDLKDKLTITEQGLIKTSLDLARTGAIVNCGDVVLGSRGLFNAAVINSDAPMVASSSVYILKIKDERVIPEYLAICLNSINMQKELLKIAKGSSIQMIFRRDLMELKIPLIPTNEQKKLIDFYKNIEKQKKLLSDKIKIQHNIANFIIRDLLSQ
jgi:restriction endonuclease S subunit